MLKPRFITPLSASALLVLLAACGGGGTTDGGTMSSTDNSIKADTAGALTTPGASTASQAADGQPSSEQISTQTATEAAGGIAPTLPKVASADPGPDAAAPAADADASQSQAIPSAVNGTALKQAVISHADGVQGAALMTMLYQKACAEPKPTDGYQGPALGEDAHGMARVFADLRLTPENYQLQGRQKPLFDTVCDPQFASFRLPQAGQGSLTLSSERHWIHDYLGQPEPRRAFHKLKVNMPVSHAKWIILGKDITVNGQSFTSASNGFLFNPAYHVGFGVLTEWQQGEQNLRLMLLPGAQDNEAKLCWNANLEQVKRLQCTTWQAPEGWQSGQMLTMVDQYIIDDRSTYPNESGMVFLHSKSY